MKIQHAYNNTFKYVWQTLEVDSIYNQVRAAMHESAEALILEYPDSFTLDLLEEHISDLLFRFQDKSLGDTISRVGRELFRKLNHEDRITGAMIQAQKYNITDDTIKSVYKAACIFIAADENGNIFERDKLFYQKYNKCSNISILEEVSLLEKHKVIDRNILKKLL